MRSNLWKIVLCLFLLVTLIGCKQSVGKKNGNENGLAKENEASKMKTKDSDSENNTDLANEKEKYMNSKLNALTEVNYKFQEVSVHDPSIIEVNGMYYVFGSHLAGAKSEDFINWELLSSGVNKTNSIIPNTTKELEEALTWAQSDTLWAPDVIQLADGRSMPLPITLDETIWDGIKEFYPSATKENPTEEDLKYGPYFDDFFEKCINVIPFGDTQIPGFVNFIGEAYAGIEDSVRIDGKNAADYASELEQKANQYNQDALAEIGE